MRLCASLALALAWGRVSRGQTGVLPAQPVERMGGDVASVVPDAGQPGSRARDMVYVNAATGSGAGASVMAGLLPARQGFANRAENQVTFHDVLGVSAGFADVTQDGRRVVVFGLSPLRPGGANFCVAFGAGGSTTSGAGGSATSGCTTLATDGQTPAFAWMAVAPYRVGGSSLVFLVDAANDRIDVVAHDAAAGMAGFRVAGSLAIALDDGAGPIYAGDVNGDGATDLIVNNRGSLSASLYAGNGDGSFQAPVRLYAGRVRRMLLADMDGDGIADLVAQSPDGAIEIYWGTRGGGSPFEGGAASAGAGVDSRGGLHASVGGAQPGAMVEARQDRETMLAADLDGDGYMDLIVTSGEGSGRVVSLWFGSGGRSFEGPIVLPLARDVRVAQVADRNGDGLPDLMLWDGHAVGTMFNNGGRSFGAADAGMQEPRANARGAVTRSPTTTTMALCVGPSPGCPITSIVVPPYVPSLTMYFGQAFNGEASASPTDGSVLDPASTIAFQDAFNGAAPVTLCTLGIQYGSACPPAIGTTVGTAVGVHVFTSTYSGDATHAPSTSPAVTLTVLPDVITGYTLVSSANPAPVGRPVTFTATLTGNYAPPTGTYPVLDAGMAIGTIVLVPVSGTNSSTGTFTTSALGVGSHAISAPYAGNGSFGAAAGPVVSQVINPALATVSRVVSSVNPSVTGQAVTFTDTVSLAGGGASPVATGLVTFLDGTAVLGTATLNGAGVAAFSTSGLAAGTHTITAASAGDGATAGSSASLAQVVTAAPPAGSVNFSVTVTPNPVSIGVGDFAAVTVRVAPVGGGFPEAVTLSCAGLPYESGCTFTHAVIAAGGGTTTLLVSTTAPHGCGSTAPYFIAAGGSGGGGGWPWGLPVAAGVMALGLPGRRRRGLRWGRALGAMVLVAGLMQMSGCGTCTDLGTRPATYTMQVKGIGAVGPEVEGTPVVLQVHL